MAHAHDLSDTYLVIGPGGRVEVLPVEPGPPPRVTGLLVSAPLMTRSPHHAGERHENGDEVLFVVSGAIRVRIEAPEGEVVVDAGPGQAAVVPQGCWHRVEVSEATQLLHLTPGPDNAYR
ncbi:MAG: cupin protein [Acidimicrobiales bacterium]|nr:cupin protein [Acidimicrobiales bacterium]